VSISKHFRRFPHIVGADEFAFEYYRENVSWKIFVVAPCISIISKFF
jgi:hypothetical protein